MDLPAIVRQLDIKDEADKQNVLEKSEDFSKTLLESLLYSNIKQAEGIGSDVDTLSANVEKKVEKHERIVEKTQDARINVQASTILNQDANGQIHANTQATATATTDNGTTTNSSSSSETTNS